MTLAPQSSSQLERSIDKLREPLERYADGMKVAIRTWFSVKSLRTELRHRDRMLEVAADWHNHLSMPALLEQIALAAANLLDATALVSSCGTNRPNSWLAIRPSVFMVNPCVYRMTLVSQAMC